MNLMTKNMIAVLKRSSISGILSVTGLAIAYAIFYMTVVQVHYDLSFDRNFEKADSIFLYSRIIPEWESSRTITNTAEPKECAERYSEIKNYCYLVQRNEKISANDDRTGDMQIIEETMTFASTGLINMFKPKILHGDVVQAFTPGHAMLTESAAKKIFGDKYPVGETISYYDSFWSSDQKLTIAALCADFPDNCSLKNGIYAYQPEIDRGKWDWTTYFEIDPPNKGKLLKRLNNEQYMQNSTYLNKETNWQYELTALPDIHLRFPAKGEGSLVTVIVLLSIGILLLVISYINFLNFAIAMAPAKVKNVSIRKIFGESPFVLKLSIIMETVLLSFVSFILSILIIYILSAGVLKDFFMADLSILKNPGLLLFAGAVSVISGFLAGMYPAFYTTAFNPAMSLSGSFFHSRHNKWLKNILTGVQFISAIFLITAMLFVKMQYNYMRNKDWGIQTGNVLYLNTKSNGQDVESFMAELKRNPNIVDVTAAEFYPGQERIRGWGQKFEGAQISINVWSVRYDFFDFFGIKMIKGEKFKEKDHPKMIVNQTFLREYDLSEGINDRYFGGAQYDYEIIGIFEDFNFKSLYEKVKPLAFITIPEESKGIYYNWTFVKTQGADTKQAMEYVRDTWKKFSDEPSEVLLLSNTVQSFYQKENNTANLVSVCGIIAIIVAIIGLYGLILFDSKAKRKSIAIRKINGASVPRIMLMLNMSLFIRFAVSCLIAFPLAYYAVQRWLEDFAYKTPVHWWAFAFGGFIVLVISLLTVSWESYKAANGDPVEVLKAE